MLTLIIFTGALVRLTDSGLGCEDWPTCSEEKIAPGYSFHGWIEFGNRLLSGVVAIAVVAAVLTAYRRTPRRPDLIRWAWYLVAGVVAQVILGGMTVRVDLHPLFVSSHFLLSIVLLWAAAVLWFKAHGGIGRPSATLPSSLIGHSLAVVLISTVLIVSGTTVTGTGPNSGDFSAERFNLDLTTVARIHGGIAWILLATLVGFAIRLQRRGHPLRSVQPVIALAVVQGGIGYLQYFTGVPPMLVMLHVIGAVSLWLLILRMHLGFYDRPNEIGGITPSTSTGAAHHEPQFLGG